MYGRTNHMAQAKRAMEDLHQAARKEPIDPMMFADGYFALKDYERAFAYLNKAVAKHSPALPSLKVDPIYDPVRSDPRFQAVLVRVGLGA